MITRVRSNRRNRRHLQPSQVQVAGNVTAVNSIVATKWRVTCPAPLSVVGTFASFAAWTVQGVAPTSVTRIDAATFDLGYAAAVVATNVGIIPANSPAARTYTGGFVNPVTKTF
jgi:hypothetical protein